MRIGDFDMQTLQFVPGKFLQRLERGAPRNSGLQIETNIRSGPARKRAAQHLQAELGKREPGKISDHIAAVAHLSQNGRGVLRLLDEFEPRASLKNGTVRKAVEQLPIGRLEINLVKLHRSPIPAISSAPKWEIRIATRC